MSGCAVLVLCLGVILLCALQSTYAASKDFDCSHTAIFYPTSKDKVEMDDKSLTVGKSPSCLNYVATYDALSGELTYKPAGDALSKSAVCVFWWWMCVYWKRSTDNMLEAPYCVEDHVIKPGSGDLAMVGIYGSLDDDDPMKMGFGFAKSDRLRCIGNGRKVSWKAGVLTYKASSPAAAVPPEEEEFF